MCWKKAIRWRRVKEKGAERGCRRRELKKGADGAQKEGTVVGWEVWKDKRVNWKQ